MNKTGIAWTDYTSNPLEYFANGKRGWFCEKVSPGCAGCYAETLNKRYGNGLAFLPQERGKIDEVRLNERELGEWVKPKYAGARVFVEDMGDLFHELVTDDMLDRVFAAMAMAPKVTFQLLTKRPERMHKWITNQGPGLEVEDAFQAIAGDDRPLPSWPLPNVWLGVTAENQRWADERIPSLLETPAAVRFVSYEPALKAVDFSPYADVIPGHYLDDASSSDYPGLDWIIIGGESGPKRRPFNLDWARAVLRQCQDADLEQPPAVFFKQTGAFRPGQPSGDPVLDAAKAFPR